MRAKLRSLIERMLVSAGPTFKRFWVSIGFTVALTTTLIMSTTGPYPVSYTHLDVYKRQVLAGSNQANQEKAGLKKERR